MTDINATIAKCKGWRRPTQDECAPEDGWINDITHYTANTLPDYLNDARLYMALFEEMPNAILRRWHDKWLCIPEAQVSKMVECFETESDIIGTAICLAYKKLYGLE